MGPISALMSLRSALMSLISAGKNGEIVFISAKSSVVSKRAYEICLRGHLSGSLIKPVTTPSLTKEETSISKMKQMNEEEKEHRH